jgi:transcriptional regulator with XRE-family HTH domain
MIGDRIKSLRIEKGMKQKDLADKLFVTAQAVSRWENNEVEPSISTILEISKIFNISIDELVNPSETQETIKEETIVIQEVVEPPIVQKPVLAVCERCNKPIYEGSDIARTTKTTKEGIEKIIYCKSCDLIVKQRLLQRKKEEEIAKEQKTHSEAAKTRKKSFIYSGLITALILIIYLSCAIPAKDRTVSIGLGVFIHLLFFPFISCLFLDNNFMLFLFAWFFVKPIKLPFLIFMFSLDGLILFFIIKIALAILSLIVSIFCIFIGTIICLAVSIFVYPYALYQNIYYPEKTWD